MASTWAVDTLRRLSTELLSYQDGRRTTSDVLDLSLELVYRDLLIQQTYGLDYSGEQACDFVRQSLLSVQEMQQNSQLTEPVHYTRSVHHGCCG